MGNENTVQGATKVERVVNSNDETQIIKDASDLPRTPDKLKEHNQFCTPEEQLEAERSNRDLVHRGILMQCNTAHERRSELFELLKIANFHNGESDYYEPLSELEECVNDPETVKFLIQLIEKDAQEAEKKAGVDDPWFDLSYHGAMIANMLQRTEGEAIDELDEYLRNPKANPRALVRFLMQRSSYLLLSEPGSLNNSETEEKIDAAIEYLAESHENEKVRIEAITSLAYKPTPENAKMLLRIAKTAPNSKIEVAAILAMSTNPDEEITDFLERKMRSNGLPIESYNGPHLSGSNLGQIIAKAVRARSEGSSLSPADAATWSLARKVGTTEALIAELGSLYLDEEVLLNGLACRPTQATVDALIDRLTQITTVGKNITTFKFVQVLKVFLYDNELGEYTMKKLEKFLDQLPLKDSDGPKHDNIDLKFEIQLMINGAKMFSPGATWKPDKIEQIDFPQP